MFTSKSNRPLILFLFAVVVAAGCVGVPPAELSVVAPERVHSLLQADPDTREPLIALPINQEGKPYQWVMVQKSVCFDPAVEILKPGYPHECRTTLVPSRSIKRKPPVTDDYHRVKAGSACYEPTRSIDETNYRVPVIAKVITEGGQIAWAHCATRGGYFSWVAKFRRLN